MSMQERRVSKPGSVWHNFRGKALEVMRASARVDHPSRTFAYGLVRRWFGRRPFEWLDAGVAGMVDYERLRDIMSFHFTGADLSESVAEDARRYLRRPADRIVVWDIEDPPEQSLAGRFDLVTLRHLLNHCEYYELPLAHAASLLRPGGRIVIVLHLKLIDGPDQLARHHDWPIPGEVIGNRYNRDRFLDYFATLFEPELWVRVDDGRKPNDMIVGRKPASSAAGPRERPTMRVLWSAPGRRNLPRRLLSRIVFALTAKLPL